MQLRFTNENPIADPSPKAFTPVRLTPYFLFALNTSYYHRDFVSVASNTLDFAHPNGSPRAAVIL